MKSDFYIKTTNYKLLGKTIFTTEEIFTNVECEGQIYNLNISKDYFDSEFKINNDEKKEK